MDTGIDENSRVIGRDGKDDWYLYTGQDEDDIPLSVKRLIVDPSVTELTKDIFSGVLSNIKHLELWEGLQSIEEGTFSLCKKLKSVSIQLDTVFDNALADAGNWRRLCLVPMFNKLEIVPFVVVYL